MSGNEDATVYRIDDTKALVQTVDLITPVVDDPFTYGQIAAANSLSDIFAMGADAITAMNIVGFDGKNHPKEVLAEILAGGESKIREAGAVVAGGHTIETPEMLYGLSVSGFINPARIYRNSTVREGDVLILTKPLAMGILTTAIKHDKLSPPNAKKVASILAQLNKDASIAMREFDVSACTDVTGFGLAGHAFEMSGGRFTISFRYGDIPILQESIPLADQGVVPGGSKKNREYLSEKCSFEPQGINDIIFYDAQTSGGLLMSVSQSDAPALLARLKNDGYEYSAIVAEVKSLGEKILEVT